MTDADSARVAKHLANIDRHLNDVHKVLTAMNENFVSFAKAFQEFTRLIDVTEEENVDDGQLELMDPELVARAIGFYIRWMNGDNEETTHIATGVLRKVSDGTYQIEVQRVGEEEPQVYALVPGGPWNFLVFFQGSTYQFSVPSFESGVTKVYGRISE